MSRNHQSTGSDKPFGRYIIMKTRSVTDKNKIRAREQGSDPSGDVARSETIKYIETTGDVPQHWTSHDKFIDTLPIKPIVALNRHSGHNRIQHDNSPRVFVMCSHIDRCPFRTP
ncbi:unnamed protein product [Arctia plantaginis]|uniref:Uncharacterized protein n=1 Tax=Arctia plantaginis TaxID=874455 RepID=A0A8S1A3Y6_ARCPL|nr:unnamed protein product [Arctia plantaginis]